MKTMGIIGIVICAIGLLGGLALISEGLSTDGFIGIIVYGFFLAQSIMIVKLTSKK